MTTTSLELLGDCPDGCLDFAEPLLEQLGSGRYDVCSVLDLAGDWSLDHRTARKRAARARRLGYAFSRIARHEYVDDIHAINTSLNVRQGRPMTAGYRERPSSVPDASPACPRHGVHTFGILAGSTLVAYSWIYRSGELALVSQILGHGGHLAGDVMYELVRGVIEAELELGGFLVYNRHDSGSDGLRYFKERLGFAPREVVWTL